MSEITTWLKKIQAANATFVEEINQSRLPIERKPGPAVITCMDPRVNLQALGIPGFESDGHCNSSVRIIRTLGGMAENRSLLVGIFLAGIREIVVLMHTDCGCCLAHSKVDVIEQNMAARLDPVNFERFKAAVGFPFEENLRGYLKSFADPREALIQEIESIRNLPFVPQDVIVHGLLYELETGRIDVIGDGSTALRSRSPHL